MPITPAVRRGSLIPVLPGRMRLGSAVVIGPHPNGAVAILPHLGATFVLYGVVYEPEVS